jgi:hypothetical protein
MNNKITIGQKIIIIGQNISYIITLIGILLSFHKHKFGGPQPERIRGDLYLDALEADAE